MKLVIIGAGSAFGSRISVDTLSREPIRDADIVLTDIDAERLETVRAYVQKVIDSNDLPGTVAATTDRREALRGADFVIVSVSVGGPAYYDKPYEFELGIPEKYGVVQTVADTVGPGGVFRALRSAKALRDFITDINALAPTAIILNYTNPMAILTKFMQTLTDCRVVGLCHGVQGTSKKMAGYIDAPYEEVEFLCAGINHMAWFLEFRHNKQDAYPRLFKAMEDPEIYKEDEIRFEMMKYFGRFCTESTRHTMEYVPYFHHDMERFRRGQDIIKGVKDNRHKWYEDMGVAASKKDSIELVRSHEYASGIMESVMTNEPFKFNGNVINHGLIANLVPGSCVEVPCLVDGCGVHPCHVGALPPHLAGLCLTNQAVQETCVAAMLERDRDLARHAVQLDPLTASILPLDKIHAMFDEMWEAEGELLADFNI